jgi:hypothetical protein
MWPVAGRQQVLAAPKMSAWGRRRGHQADSASAGGVQDMAEIVAGRFWLVRLGSVLVVVEVAMRDQRRGIARWSLVAWSARSDRVSQWQWQWQLRVPDVGTGRVVSCSQQRRKRRVRVGCLAGGVRRDQAMRSS